MDQVLGGTRKLWDPSSSWSNGVMRIHTVNERSSVRTIFVCCEHYLIPHSLPLNGCSFSPLTEWKGWIIPSRVPAFQFCFFLANLLGSWVPFDRFIPTKSNWVTEKLGNSSQCVLRTKKWCISSCITGRSWGCFPLDSDFLQHHDLEDYIISRLQTNISKGSDFWIRAW